MRADFPIRSRLALPVIAILVGAAACRDGAGATDADASTARARPATASPPASPERNWSGRYSYAYDGGKTAGGSAIVVTYTLTIDPSSCRLEAEGYQTDETILCHTRAAGDTLDVLFRSYGDGGTNDRYGNAVYSVGDPLFALERRGGGVLTRWKGYALPDDKPHPPGVFFRR